MKGRNRALALLGGVAFSTFFVAGAAYAQDREFNIPSESAVIAIPEFARQAGIQILAPADSLKGVRTPAIKGHLDIHSALGELLAGTGITIASEDGQTIALSAPSKNVEAASDAGAASPSSDSIPMVVVTAEKRAENLKDVPMSVAVVSAKDLQQYEVHNLDDLLGVVPGVTIQHSGGDQRVAIDGVANIFGDSSTVGIYVDDASATVGGATQLNIATVDLARVEVLRGPQGTLYGDGSIGGTIRFITRSPDLESYQFAADVGASTTQRGSPSEYFQPVVNIPLIEGQLALRVAASFNHDGGWVSDPTNNLKDINYTDRADVRSELLWRPNDKLKVEAMVINHRLYGTDDVGWTSPNTYVPMPPINGPTYMTDNYDFYNLSASYDFGFATLHSSTTYFNFSLTESAQLTDPIAGPESGPGAVPPIGVVVAPEVEADHDINEEIRLTSDPGSPVVWDLGYFYERQRSSSDDVNYYYAQEPGIGPGNYGPLPLALFDYFANTVLESSSYFGNVSYRFFDRLTLGAGLRYYGDIQHNVNGFDDLSQYDSHQTKHDHSLDPRFDADLKVTDNVNVYGSIAKGFRSGGFNLSAGIPGVGLPGYNPEEDWRYEVGAKGRFFDGRLSADIAAFYTDYDNYIVFGFVPVPGLGDQEILTNGGDAKIEGLTWDLAWAPASDWLIKFSGDYIYSKFAKVRALTEHAVGDPVDFVSPVQATFSVQRDFEVKGRPGYVLADVQSQAPESYINRNANGLGNSNWYVGHSGQLTLLNVRAQLQWNEHLTVGVYGNNLLNDRGALNPLIPEQDVNYERPMSFGIDAHVNF